jgi:hypothetical protein
VIALLSSPKGSKRLFDNPKTTVDSSNDEVEDMESDHKNQATNKLGWHVKKS